MKFTLLALAVVVALFAVLYEVDAVDPNSGPGDDTYTWQYVVNEVTIIQINGTLYTERDIAVISSEEKDTAPWNTTITKASIVYDYTNTSSIVVIVPYRHCCPCLIIKTVLTLIQVKDEVAANIVTPVTVLPKVELDGTHAELTSEERKTFAETNPHAKEACDKRRIIQTYTTKVDKAKSGKTRPMRVIGLEADYRVTVMKNK